MPLNSGQVLNNRYRIVKLLGQGGFGAVYRAWDINLEKPCALKENLDTSPEAQRQFKQEARLLSNLSHPNLPRVIDHFILPNQGQYLVMDYVEGEDLAQTLQRLGGSLPEAQAVAWIAQVCDALSYMHSQNPPVIHRDIKPANIKINPQGKAMLVDFGIAKIYDPGLRTTVGARAVTPGYSPTEQYTSTGSTDARTDLYALGATLYTLLTGQAPPEAPERNLGVSLPAPRLLNPALSAQVETAVLKALEMQPGCRWQSAAEFKKAISPQPAAVSRPQVSVSSVQSTIYSGQSAAQPIPQSPITNLQLPNLKSKVSNLKWLYALGAVIVLALVLWALFGRGGGGGGKDDFPATLTTLAELDAQQTETARPARTRAPTDTPEAIWTPGPTATPLPTDTPPPTATAAGFPGMVLIPAGEFQMGSADGDSNEKPVHGVSLDAFYMDVYEVTNAQYAACVQTGSCTPPEPTSSYSRSSYYGAAAYNDYPVIYVDWSQARAYCQWRGGDLPTEAQWEKAARGGLPGKKYPWGDEDPDCARANFGGASGCVGDTSAVGSYSPNGYGLYDMAGNVWEWALDWYQANYYSSQSTWSNPFGPSSGDGRVLRGGSWLGIGCSLRSASRDGYTPSYRDYGLGLRCSRSR